jgi:hypothetical protein
MNRIKLTQNAIILLLLTSCAAFAPSPTLATDINDIVGIWQSAGGGGAEVFYQFEQDGTYRVARGVVENLEDQTYVTGEFWFEGMQLHLKQTTATVPQDDVCATAIAIYEVQLLENGNLNFVVIEDACTQQVRILQGEWEPSP